MQLFQLLLDQVPSLMDEMNTVNIDESSQFMIKSTYLGRYGCSLGLGIFGFGFIAMCIHAYSASLKFHPATDVQMWVDTGRVWQMLVDQQQQTRVCSMYIA